MIRCPWAIKFGITLNTRCTLEAGHPGLHVAKGLADFDHQRIDWHPGHGNEFLTDRDDEHAWEIAP